MIKKIEEYFSIIIFIIIILLVFLQIISRYLLKESLSFSEEIVRYMFVWLTFISISIAFKDNKHIKINLFSDKYNFFQSNLYNYMVKAVSLAFFIILFIFSVKMIILQIRTGQRIVSGLPTYLLGFSSVAGSLLVLLFFIKQLMVYRVKK